MTSDEKNNFISSTENNNDHIYPYIGGAEINTSPTQSYNRYVINFKEMSEDEVKVWPDLYNALKKSVMYERQKKGDNYSKNYWWRHLRSRPELYKSIENMDQCLVIPQQFPNKVRLTFQPTNQVFSQKLIVLPLKEFSAFAILQSRIHDIWTQLHCGEMGSANTPVYLPSDCFNTFPFPFGKPEKGSRSLDKAGQELYSVRSKYMMTTEKGLTQTYNALINSDNTDEGILELRLLHETMDRTVLDAYGWTDIEVPPYCPLNPEEEAAVEAFNDEVIDRLYVLNAVSATEEERLGLTKVATKKLAPKKTQNKKLSTPNPTLDLF